MPELFQYQFMQHAILAGILSSLVCGVIGSYVVVKRISLISGGISHASLGGIGLAVYLGLAPLLGAAVFAILSAVIIGAVSLYSREHEDTLIGALWSVGMALGLVFIQMTPGYAVNLENYLFGNILLVSQSDLLAAAVLDVLILGTVAVLYKEFLAVSLDDEFAALRGLPVGPIYILLLCLVALTVVVLIQVVGVILLIALLTLPAAISRWHTQHLYSMMTLASVLGATFSVCGILISYSLDFPPGPCIVLLTAAVYIVGLGLRRLRAGTAVAA